MTVTHRVLSHTADTGIEATADSLAGLIVELAMGMFGLEAALTPSAAARWIDTTVESPTLEDLVVDTLSELLYLAETEDLVLCAFAVEASLPEHTLIVRAGGVPVAETEASGPPIKAVTYHGLTVERRGHEWFGRVYFDV